MGTILPINTKACITDLCRQGREPCPTPDLCVLEPPRFAGSNEIRH